MLVSASIEVVLYPIKVHRTNYPNQIDKFQFVELLRFYRGIFLVQNAENKIKNIAVRYNKLAFSPLFSCFLTFWFLNRSEYQTLTKPESVTYQRFQAFIIVFWHQYRPAIWQNKSYLLTFNHIRFVQKVENKKVCNTACYNKLSFSHVFSVLLVFDILR